MSIMKERFETLNELRETMRKHNITFEELREHTKRKEKFK